nr:arginase family protein [Vibrio nigripulchritudo]
MGGDHSISLPLITTASEFNKELQVIHFDAHSDFYGTGDDIEINHSNFMHSVAKLNNVKHILQLGLREYQSVTNYDVLEISKKISFFNSEEVESFEISELLESIDKDIPCYISFDIDVLDPTLSMHTGSPVVGGLSYLKTSKVLKFIYNNFKVVGIDFVELSSCESSRNISADVASELVTEFILSKVDSKKLERNI